MTTLPKVLPIAVEEWGDVRFVVPHTDDVEVATALVWSWIAGRSEIDEDDLDGDSWPLRVPHPLTVSRRRLWRRMPCRPYDCPLCGGEGYAFHIWPVDEPGRGVFRAIAFERW